MNSQRIFLCGMMGVGKSTVGQSLADALGYRFQDSDVFIVQQVQKSIAEIFKTDGEASFRKLEQNAIRTLCSSDKTVISLGGGALMNLENLELIKKSGTLVYLKAHVDQILSRLASTLDTRPLLSGLDQNQRRQKIQTLLIEREAHYKQAHLTIETDHRSVQETVEEICRKLPKKAT